MAEQTAADDDPEWLPGEYDVDADLHERLPIMADIDGGVELHVGDKRGVIEIVGAPRELTESGMGVLTVKCGPSVSDWNYEIVVPKPENGDPFLRDVDPNQPFEDYVNTRETVMSDIDVRIYGVDHGLLDGHAGTEGE